ncbi:MAG: type II CAAX endopeptidase family protein [Planctomycetota bacterium]|nr:type II CAAX endopeptidase family protein [Planctomycetota bacterium]
MTDHHPTDLPGTPPTTPNLPLEDDRRPDPGSRGMAKVAWIALIVLVATVAYLQQGKAASSAAEKPAQAVIQPEPGSPIAMMARLMTRLMIGLREMDRESAGGKATSNTPQITEAMKGAVNDLDKTAKSAPEILRAAIVAAELLGAEEGTNRLAILEAKLKPNELEGMDAAIKLPEEQRDQLLADIAAVRARLSGATVEPAAEDALVQRHGWFGRLNAAYDKPASDRLRAKILSESYAVIIAMVVLLIGFVGVAFASFVCSIIWIVRITTRERYPQFVAPAPGGSVYLETVAAFVGVFLLFQLGLGVVEGLVAGGGTAPEWFGKVHLAGQWLVLPVIFYPLLRGVSWSQWKADLGWNTGRGVFREIGSGIFHYFAGLPLLLLGAIISLIAASIHQLVTGSKDEGVNNPILDLVGGSDMLTIVLLYVLATVWAPIVEETIFRGAMFRHLRSRMVAALAAVVSALVFGVMHGYQWFMLMPVISLGFIFALMRERRDSLIGPVFTHAMHNGTVMLVLITMLSLMGE